MWRGWLQHSAASHQRTEQQPAEQPWHGLTHPQPVLLLLSATGPFTQTPGKRIFKLHLCFSRGGSWSARRGGRSFPRECSHSPRAARQQRHCRGCTAQPRPLPAPPARQPRHDRQTLPAWNTAAGASHGNHPQTPNRPFVRTDRVGFCHRKGRSAIKKPLAGIPLPSLPDFLQCQIKRLKCSYEGKPSFNCKCFEQAISKAYIFCFILLFFFFLKEGIRGLPFSMKWRCDFLLPAHFIPR